MHDFFCDFQTIFDNQNSARYLSNDNREMYYCLCNVDKYRSSGKHLAIVQKKKKKMQKVQPRFTVFALGERSRFPPGLARDC